MLAAAGSCCAVCARTSLPQHCSLRTQSQPTSLPSRPHVIPLQGMFTISATLAVASNLVLPKEHCRQVGRRGGEGKAAQVERGSVLGSMPLMHAGGGRIASLLRLVACTGRAALAAPCLLCASPLAPTLLPASTHCPQASRIPPLPTNPPFQSLGPRCLHCPRRPRGWCWRT